MTVAILVAISLPGLVRAQSGADTAPVIPLHPRVATVLQLPDAIEHTRVLDRDEIRMAIVGDKLYLRPRAGTPAGVEASLEVETRTARWTFRLRVVARASDASREIRVLPAEAPATPVEAPAIKESTSETPPEVPAESVAPPEVPAEPVAPPEVPAGPVKPPLAVAPEAAEPAASAPTDAPGTAPVIGPEPAEKPAEEPAGPTTAPVATGIRSPRPEISVHAIGSLGFTSLDVAGYAPFVARQSHLGLGVRLRVARPDAWWAVEANVSGDRLAGPISYLENNNARPQFKFKGPWLRAEVGLRARFGGTSWASSAYAGLGVQAHLRRIEKMNAVPETVETMPRGAVLVLGIGLERRVGGIPVGLDFQVRQGGPDGYHSAAMLWTVGCVLEQGE
jgi:hypothetical protein